MKYLISEVEFYEPTIEQFEGKVVVLRRDQLEGEKLYVAPKKIMNVAASFSDEKKSIILPNFADIVIFFQAINASFSFDAENSTVSATCDNENIDLIPMEDRVLMEISEFGPTCRSLYDFMDSLGIHVSVATTLPKTVDLNAQEEEPSENLSEAIDGLGEGQVSDEEKEAVISDSKDGEEKPTEVEVVDTVEEALDK